MTKYTYGELQSLWLDSAKGTKYESSGWAHLMAAIALAESAGNSDATNPTDNGGTQTSWGLWQISTGTHATPDPNWGDPMVNARLAIGKLDSQGLRAWGTYTSGAYKQYMSGAGPTSLPPGAGSGGTNTGEGATTTSFNPITWTETNVPGGLNWLGKLITGQVGGGATGLAGIGDIGTGIAGLVRTFNKLIQLYALLFRPSTWLRAGAFFVGIVSIGGAIYFFGKTI